MGVSSTEIKNRVAGLSYVARTSKNPELAEEAKQQMMEIYRSIDTDKKGLLSYVEAHMSEFEAVPRNHRSGASEIADMLEEASTSYNTVQILTIYIFFVLSIALYISSINSSLRNLAFHKN